MDQILYEVKMPGLNPVLLKLWFSDNPAATKNCDACIGYSIHDLRTYQTTDGGEMDYNSETAGYQDISDAVEDVIDFAFDGVSPEYAAPSGLDPDDMED